MRVMTFANAKDDIGSSFADNIAGWVSEELGRHPDGLAFPLIGNSFNGEIWRRWPWPWRLIERTYLRGYSVHCFTLS